jgi:hypothetical protein
MSIEEKIKAEIVRRSGIDQRKVCVCVIPFKSDRESGNNETNR